MLTELYRKHVSPELREKIYRLFLGDLLSFTRNPKGYWKCLGYAIRYTFISPKTEKEKAEKILGEIGLSPYPYEWVNEYIKRDYTVLFDSEKELRYVLHNEKKLYFTKKMDTIAIETAYRSLLIEQDEQSAHRYVGNYEELSGKILLDVGAAEGIFSLDTIEYIDHAYLFECEEEWLDALNATFEPWKEKVTIVKKYVSDTNEGDFITLDSFFSNTLASFPKNLFIKMDIEGAELKALKGCINTLQRCENSYGSICIYHNREDERDIESFFEDLSFKTLITSGYLYIGNEMRRGVVRFEKQKI
ncbi:FkbM family methyltransferase [Parabacteroides sp. OttesenSCG-928-G07]|nr:FkbM family methyltransferase [Parabacteroides sp. OttesenSCG-928-G21]MDL2277824.1 FkbM family methyltransferase [Parabacteroides sp. OttesenSCG-928-G07]